MPGTLRLVGPSAGPDWIGDYECECGQTYRVARTPSGPTFWPSAAASGFPSSAHGTGTPCVSCGDALALTGRRKR